MEQNEVSRTSLDGKLGELYESALIENNLVNEVNSDGNDEVEEITIIIDGEKIICNKRLLLNESDYFRAMFKGNFREKDKNTIVLKGVSPKSMRNLLNILKNRQNFTLCDDVFALLSVCGMLLFEDLKTWIISQLDQTVTSNTSLQMWMELEPLEIIPLCWKAKSISLNNFNEIIDNGTILDLNLTEVCIYLGHTNLQCDTELSVFQQAMCWYLKHIQDRASDNEHTLKRLLACINFKQLTLEEIGQMKGFMEIEKNSEISMILEYIKMLKSGLHLDENTENDSYKLAEKWLCSRSRYQPKYPCLLLKNDVKRTNVESSADAVYEVAYYDDKSNCFKQFSDWPIDKCIGLTGFGIQDYKMKILLFGGEFSLGKGSWNCDVWSFDCANGKLEQKQSIPTPRRHFQSCVCGNYLYVIGGTGTFRIIQNNMIWYDFQKDTWSKEVTLPISISGWGIKCCSLNNQLFIWSGNLNCGFLFCHEAAMWKKVTIEDNRGVFQEKNDRVFMFSSRGNLFLKVNNLVELELIDDKLKLKRVLPLPTFNKDDFVEMVANHNLVYILYKHTGEDEEKMSLESLNLDTLESKFLFEFSDDPASTRKIGECKSVSVAKLFMFHHYDLVSHNILVN